jgi:3-oxoacyl-[acyl-carrier protein] reductase
MRLNKQVAVVTGAGQGIGFATATTFAREGATVICCDIRQDGVDGAVAACLEASGGEGRHEGIALDVTNRAAVDAMAQAVLARHGQIDILVNNAGITRDARLQRMTIEQFDAVIDINLRGVFHCTQAVVDAMVARGRGTILNASASYVNGAVIEVSGGMTV